MADDVSPVKEVTYGAIAGMVGKVVEYPFDTIKVRLQSSNQHLKSTFDMVWFTYRHEGLIKGFYQGLKAPMIGACMESAVLFLSYNVSTSMLQRVWNDNDDKSTPTSLWMSCFSGGVAGFMASFVLTPIELIKCKLQVSNMASTAVSSTKLYTSVIKQILKHDGITGFWNGLSATFLREIGGTAIWFGTYEYMNLVFRQSSATNELSDTHFLISGAMAGVTFNASFFPADTIKSNIQTHDILHRGEANARFLDTGKTLIKRPGGIRNLYKGLGITLVRAVPANALIFYTYEMLKRSF